MSEADLVSALQESASALREAALQLRAAEIAIRQLTAERDAARARRVVIKVNGRRLSKRSAARIRDAVRGAE